LPKSGEQNVAAWTQGRQCGLVAATFLFATANKNWCCRRYWAANFVAAQYATGGPLLRSGDIAYGDIGRQLPAATPPWRRDH